MTFEYYRGEHGPELIRFRKDPVLVHITFLNDEGKVIDYHKVSPGAHLGVPEGAISYLEQATSEEIDDASQTIRVRLRSQTPGQIKHYPRERRG